MKARNSLRLPGNSSLPIRLKADGKQSVHEYLGAVKEKIRKAIENQGYPLEEMLADKRKEGYEQDSLFNVMFAIAEDNGGEIEIDGLKLSGRSAENSVAKFDLTGYVFENQEQAEITWEYKTGKYSEETIERIAGSYGQVLRQLLENTDKKLSEITLLKEEEYNT